MVHHNNVCEARVLMFEYERNIHKRTEALKREIERVAAWRTAVAKNTCLYPKRRTWNVVQMLQYGLISDRVEPDVGGHLDLGEYN